MLTTCQETIYEEIDISPLPGKKFKTHTCGRNVTFDVKNTYTGFETKICGIHARVWRKKARVEVTPIEKGKQ